MRAGASRPWAELVGALAARTDRNGRCEILCRQAATHFGFSRALLATVDRRGRRLVARAAYDPSLSLPLYKVLTHLWAAPLEPAPDGRVSVAMWCYQQMETVHVPDTSRYAFRPQQTYQRDRVVRAVGCREYLLTPVTVRRRPLGLLAVDKRGLNEPISEADRETASRLADLASLALSASLAEPPAEPTNRSAPLKGDDRFLDRLIDAIHEGLLVFGGDGRVKFVNRAAASILGVPPGEAIGRTWPELVPTDPPLDPGGAEDLLTGADPSPQRITLGGGAIVEIEPLPLSLPSVSDSHAILIEDVSRTVEVERLRDEFTSMLVHDLKAPVQSILGFGELLRLGRLGEMNDDQIDFMQRIEASADQMMTLIEEILVMATFESRRAILQKRRVESGPLIASVMDRLCGKADPRGIRLASEIGCGGAPAVFADPVRLESVFQNLIDNAIDACEDGGRVTLRAATISDRAEPLVRFEVVDDGPGLSEESARHLFDKFWVGHGSNGRSHGLGLVIARLIVESHRGRIHAASRGERGTMIAFTIPAWREPAR